MKERIVAVAILVFALVYLAGSLALKVGTLAAPGAGQFPAIVAFVLLVVAAVHARRTFRSSEEAKSHSWTQIAPAGIAAALIVYPVLLHLLSYLLATFVVLFALFRLLGVRRNATSLLSAGLATVVSFVVFAGLLGVVLPSGAVEQSILGLMGAGG